MYVVVHYQRCCIYLVYLNVLYQEAYKAISPPSPDSCSSLLFPLISVPAYLLESKLILLKFCFYAILVQKL